MSGTSTSFNGGGPSASFLGISGSPAIGTSLMRVLMSDEITPGYQPSYQLCKDIYLYHPLGMKMAEAPINKAQSRPREIKVEGHPDRVKKAFIAEWQAIKADTIIHNTMKQARIYGIASVVLGMVAYDADKPIEPDKLATGELFFNVFDPLNTSGSLVLDQNPNSPTFQKSTSVTVAGATYHRSRVCIVMNEEPIYIAYTSSAFGFVGRSVYQRALFPLKSFIGTMITDDMISRKAGLLIAKMQEPGSIVNRMMQAMIGVKRVLLKAGETNQVLSIGIDEDIASLNLQNIDGAGGFARTNILKNIATAADMPAKMLENETMVAGFGEGTEDAKNIAEYIDRVRTSMQPLYEFMDLIVQRRAWNKEFYAGLQKKFPKTYGKVSYESAFSQWQNAFDPVWPSMLQEPDSERVKTDDVKLKAIIGVVEALLPTLDPDNKARLIEWMTENINDTELLFAANLDLDIDGIREQAEKNAAMPPPGAQAGESDDQDGDDPNKAPTNTPKPPPFRLAAAR